MEEKDDCSVVVGVRNTETADLLGFDRKAPVTVTHK